MQFESLLRITQKVFNRKKSTQNLFCQSSWDWTQFAYIGKQIAILKAESGGAKCNPLSKARMAKCTCGLSTNPSSPVIFHNVENSSLEHHYL